MLSEKEIFSRIERDPQSLIPVEGVRLKVERKSFCPASAKVDFVFKLSSNKRHAYLIAEVLSKSSRAHFANKLNEIKEKANHCQALPLIIAPYLSPDERALCHDRKVLFLDLSGNQWISAEGILIEREGFKNMFPEARGVRNPFSDKASLIIRELIANYGQKRGVRELADFLELSPGFVSKIVIELDKRGYIQKTHSGLSLISPEELISDWVNHYNIRDNMSHNYFLSVISVDEVLKKIRELGLPIGGYAVTAQAGANLVYQYAAYDVVHVYVKDQQVWNFMAKSLNLQPVDRGENVILMEPKYKKSVFFHSRTIKGLNVVSDLQLYLDLYHYPKRGREQAERIYDLKIAPLFKE